MHRHTTFLKNKNKQTNFNLRSRDSISCYSNKLPFCWLCHSAKAFIPFIHIKSLIHQCQTAPLFSSNYPIRWPHICLEFTNHSKHLKNYIHPICAKLMYADFIFIMQILCYTLNLKDLLQKAQILCTVIIALEMEN